MAKIELYKDKINNMSNLFEDLRSKKSSYAMNLNKLSTNLMAIDCVDLASAISDLSIVNKDVDEQIDDLNKLQREFEDYVLSVKTIDNKVAEYIRGLPEFYLPYYSPSKNWTQNTKLPTAAEYIRALPKTGEPYRSNLEWVNQKDQLATASEYISKIHLKINKFIRDFAPYMISEYIEYDSENNCYKVKDPQKLKELLTKESPSEADIEKMAYIFGLAVDDDGNIDTEFLKQLIKCSYKEQRHYSEGEIRYETHFLYYDINGNEIDTVFLYITYEYYTTYTKSSNISSFNKSICASLSGDKYRDLRAILAALNDEIEGAHFHGEVPYKIYTFFTSNEYKKYLKDKFTYIEKTNGTDIFEFDVNIETSDVLDSSYKSKIKQYDITYSTSAKDEKKSDYPSYTVYQYADKNGLISDIFHDIHQDMNESDYNYVINAIENFRKDENMDYSGIEKGFGFWAAGKLAGLASEAVPGLDWAVDIASFADAYNDAVAQQEENKRNNAEIDNISQNLDRRKIVQAIESAATSEASLRGQLGNYIVKKDSSGIVTDIFVSNMTIDDSRFANEYKDFQQYKADHNETIPSDISHFDDLTPDLQKEMIRWKLFP